MATYTENYQLTKPTMAEIADIRTINNNMDSIDDIMHASQVSIADAYSHLLTYEVGDYVMYEKLLYECITAINTPETWDPTKWQRAVAANAKPPVMTGATASEDGESGLVPAPLSTDKDKYLKGDGTWETPSGGGGDANYEELTQAEYNALTQEEKMNGTIYFITDGQGGGGSGSGGNVYGAFIDTNRVIQAFTLVQDTQEHTYTATEDCVVIYTIAANSNTDVYIKVDNIVIGGQYSQNISTSSGYVYLKKGQTFSYQQTYTSSSNSGYTVYGLTFGTNNIFTPQIYSLEEREVGVWIDGSTVYEKTYEFNTPVQISMEAWTDVNDYIPNIGFGKIIEAKGIDANGTLQGSLLCGKNASNHIQLQSPRNGSANIALSYIIIRYTKTT